MQVNMHEEKREPRVPGRYKGQIGEYVKFTHADLVEMFGEGIIGPPEDDDGVQGQRPLPADK